MSAGRLLLVTARFPFGSQEAYLNVELAELARYFDDVVVVPARPPASEARYCVPDNVRVLDWPLLNAEILRRAAAAAAVAPLRAVRTFGKIIGSRDPGRLKNLAVFVKGLALGQWAAEHRVDHIHAYWMSTPSTVAMVAASTSRLPWSATAHRWDIYERNAFDVKERSVEYVRAISARGARDYERACRDSTDESPIYGSESKYRPTRLIAGRREAAFASSARRHSFPSRATAFSSPPSRS